MNPRVLNPNHTSGASCAARSDIARAVAFAMGVCFSGAALSDVPIEPASPSVDGAIPEILVTAELRETPLMQTSRSVSVFDAQQLRELSSQHLEQVLSAAPNVNFSAGTSRGRYVQLRGIGDRSQFVEPLNASVGLLIDGVDFSGLGAVATTFDVEQIEILRGPQGTLHGANALAGLVNIRTAAPASTFSHAVSAGLGNYGTRELGLVSTGPLSDEVNYRVAAQQFNSNGYIKNAFLNKDNTNERDELTVRAKLRWTVNDTHTVDVGLHHIDVDNGYDAFSFESGRTTRSDEPGRDAQRSNAIVLQTVSDLSGLRLESRLSGARSDVEYSYDEDWTFVGFHPDEYSSFDQYLRDRDSVGAELRAISNDNSRLFGGRSEWVVGLYYLANEDALKRRYTYAADFDSRNDTESVALYGQLDTALAERLNLVTGLRWERRAIDYSDVNGVAFDTDTQLWGGKLALEYSFDDAMVYGSVSRGYSADGVNAGVLATDGTGQSDEVLRQLANAGTFDEETLLSYELGVKAPALNGAMALRAAVFYMDREDQQVRSSLLIPREGGATSFLDFTSNAGGGNNYGIELEADWRPLPELRVWSALGLLETEYEDYVNLSGDDLDGREQAHAPTYQYSLGGRYDFNDGLFARVELQGRDGFFYSDRHNEKSASVDLVNASVGYEDDHWEAKLWVRNLTNEDYGVRGFGSFGNDPRNGYETQLYEQLGEPRVFGVSARYQW